jgi:hypothetical protein
VKAEKTFTAAHLLSSLSIWLEGPDNLAINAKQAAWIGWRSLSIFVYHVILSLLCSLVTSSATVEIIESILLVVAFGIIVLIPLQTRKDRAFWAGTVTILVSTLTFEISHPRFVTRHREFVSEFENAAILPRAKALAEWNNRKKRSRDSWSSWSNAAEPTFLLDGSSNIEDVSLLIERAEVGTG